MSKHEVEKLIGMVSTTEWGPLPLDEVAVVTGGSSKGAGNSFRGWLGISGSRGFGKRPKAGLTFIHNAYGQRFARSYQYHPNGSRYYWRRFPQSTSDGSIVEDAVRRFGVAFMVNGEPKSAQLSSYESLRAQIEAHEAEEARLLAEVAAVTTRAEAASAPTTPRAGPAPPRTR
jgi:hypothetical protein